jgi:hypothetical protein
VNHLQGNLEVLMSRKRTELRRIREILRLHHELDYSDREIGRVFKISHTTVGKICSAIKEAGYTWPLADDVDDNLLQRICYPTPSHANSRRPHPD